MYRSQCCKLTEIQTDGLKETIDKCTYTCTCKDFQLQLSFSQMLTCALAQTAIKAFKFLSSGTFLTS